MRGAIRVGHWLRAKDIAKRSGVHQSETERVLGRLLRDRSVERRVSTRGRSCVPIVLWRFGIDRCPVGGMRHDFRPDFIVDGPLGEARIVRVLRCSGCEVVRPR